jgi:ribosomal protein S27AE
MIDQAISTDTNHAGQSITSVEAALSFAKKVRFPEYGLVVMSDRDSTTCEDICKGINDEKSLMKMAEKTIDKKREIWIETDLRALHNPTPMEAIKLATDDLIRKLNSFCPRCSQPGFDAIEKKAVLPCRLCGFPTSMIRVEIFGCHQCGYQEERPSADAGEKAEPMYCEYCNP